MGWIDPKFPAQIRLRVVGRGARDVVRALDTRKERAADARFERSFGQSPGLLRDWDLVERRGNRRRTGPVVIEIAGRPVLEMRHLVTCQGQEGPVRLAGIRICATEQ